MVKYNANAWSCPMQMAGPWQCKRMVKWSAIFHWAAATKNHAATTFNSGCLRHRITDSPFGSPTILKLVGFMYRARLTMPRRVSRRPVNSRSRNGNGSVIARWSSVRMSSCPGTTKICKRLVGRFCGSITAWIAGPHMRDARC